MSSARKAMLGLWAAESAPQVVTLHTAFRVSWADVLAAPDFFRNAGITPLDFDGRRTDLPVVLARMPAAAVYFRDPDGHLLEYIAMLPHEPRPDCGVVPWRTWELMQRARRRVRAPHHHEQRGFAQRGCIKPHGRGATVSGRRAIGRHQERITRSL
jgi:hypothetical protein